MLKKVAAIGLVAALALSPLAALAQTAAPGGWRARRHLDAGQGADEAQDP